MSLSEAIETLRLLDPRAAESAEAELEEITEERDSWESDYEEKVKEYAELEERFDNLKDCIEDIKSLAEDGSNE